MGYQFDDLAKDVARVLSRRRVLGTLLGGVAGAVVSFILPGRSSDAASMERGVHRFTER